MIKVNEYIDHTLLKPDTTSKDIINLCKEAEKFSFKSVCINPCFVALAKKELRNSDVKICTVISFPLGSSKTKIKEYETLEAIKDGADEVDVVMNISRAKEHDYLYIENEIKSIKKITTKKKIILKIIIETCLLTNKEIIQISSICKKIGVDFIKTSTGFSKMGAVAKKISLIKKIVGNNIGIKASGGIHTYKEAITMINAGATRIGSSNSIKIISDTIRRIKNGKKCSVR